MFFTAKLVLLHTFKNLTFQVYLQNSIAVLFGKKNIIEAQIGTGQFFASVPSIPNTYESVFASLSTFHR